MRARSVVDANIHAPRYRGAGATASRQMRVELGAAARPANPDPQVRVEPSAPSAPSASFAAAPIQHIVAAMYLNNNATAVRLAQAALASPNMSSHFSACYEWTVAVRAFAFFNSRSNCTRCATMPPDVERRMQQMVFDYAAANNGIGKFCGGVPPSPRVLLEAFRAPWVWLVVTLKAATAVLIALTIKAGGNVLYAISKPWPVVFATLVTCIALGKVPSIGLLAGVGLSVAGIGLYYAL